MYEYDSELLVEKLKTLLEALERIPRRFADIATPAAYKTWESRRAITDFTD